MIGSGEIDPVPPAFNESTKSCGTIGLWEASHALAPFARGAPERELHSLPKVFCRVFLNQGPHFGKLSKDESAFGLPRPTQHFSKPLELAGAA